MGEFGALSIMAGIRVARLEYHGSIRESRGGKSEGGDCLEVRLKVREDLLVKDFHCHGKEPGIYSTKDF